MDDSQNICTQGGHGMEEYSKGGVLGRLLKKWRDFDIQGNVDSVDKLVTIPGLYDLKEVAERLPFNKQTLKLWSSNQNTNFRECFLKLPVGGVKSRIYIDLQALGKKLNIKIEPEEPS